VESGAEESEGEEYEMTMDFTELADEKVRLPRCDSSPSLAPYM
jgi:hypothetical protein